MAVGGSLILVLGCRSTFLICFVSTRFVEDHLLGVPDGSQGVVSEGRMLFPHPLYEFFCLPRYDNLLNDSPIPSFHAPDFLVPQTRKVLPQAARIVTDRLHY